MWATPGHLPSAPRGLLRADLALAGNDSLPRSTTRPNHPARSGMQADTQALQSPVFP